MAQQVDFVSELRAGGFRLVEDGSAVIVIGSRERIPVDRPINARDLISPTRARRFESARIAVQVLLGAQVEEV